MTNCFKILLEFKGFGDPSDGGVWFIGIEEAGEWGKNPEQDKEAYKQYTDPRGWFPLKPSDIDKQRQRRWEEERKPFTRIYDVMSKVMVRLLELSPNGWKEYRNNQLLQKGSKTFWTNLFPVGKPSIKSWPDRYPDLFGISSAEECRKIARERRFPMLHNFWCESHPSLTICFGKSFWPDFRKFVKLEENQFETCNRFQFTKGNLHIVFTPFFRPGRFMMSDEAIAQLVKEIQRRGWWK